MKPAERQLARQLRRESGSSIKQIADQLGVSKSSVSLWTRDIELTPAQHAVLRAANPIYNQQLRGQEGRSRSARAARRAAQAHGRALAGRADPVHQQGCMLYWAEGSKNRNSVRFTNSDVDMMRVFIRFLEVAYSVPRSAMVLNVNCFLTNGLALDEIESWWLKRLQLPPTSLRQSTINNASRISKRQRNTLPYGTARVAHHSTFVVQSIYGAIQEYAGIDRPEWLG